MGKLTEKPIRIMVVKGNPLRFSGTLDVFNSQRVLATDDYEGTSDASWFSRKDRLPTTSYDGVSRTCRLPSNRLSF